MENIDEKDKERANELFEKLQKDNIKNEEIRQAEEKAKFLGGLANDFSLLLSMLKDSLKGNYTIPISKLSMIIGAVLYVVLPLDAIPDFIPALGFADDIGVVGIVIKSISDILKDYKEKMNK